ncbi:UDP-galactose transporter family protein [Toxoplasma gondii GAB2-2007-GAL-DOM2]|uniref:UDP-galactose transporter family protein n=2 Tax=Toxoplasma gondii TaxID=5811 RepID=B9QJ78_TOXGV|nr:UDP-galactose transporter family protein [Toxoplasma gondii VEG]KFG35408.1 UDP-galactose transporter family protein [Toxoplasma gondii GAB2-2007-GAL-DOM2]CEL72317.1 TPA: UDP-galactose transporter protein, putative [Toxoplasma gondii VEG]
MAAGSAMVDKGVSPVARRKDKHVTGAGPSSPFSNLSTTSGQDEAQSKAGSPVAQEKATGVDSTNVRQVLLMVVIVTGIYFFFLMFGYYQEQIYHQVDPTTGKRFSFSFFLVFVICASNSFFSLGLLLLQTRGNAQKAFHVLDTFIFREVLFISLSYSGAMLCTNYALTHVNYPTQVLVKSAKMVPIVLGGFFVFRKTYPWYDYLSVAVVTGSLVLFNFAKAGSSSKHTESTAVGILLLCVSLFCDGLTGPRQDRLMARYTNLGPVLMMFLTNLFSTVWTAIASLLIEGEQPFLFLKHDPDALGSFAAFTVSGSLGQLFIYQSLRAFGSLYTSLFTTLRKATSTVLSVYIFGHHMTPVQWISMFCIFLTLLVQSYCSKKFKKHGKGHRHHGHHGHKEPASPTAHGGENALKKQC